MRLRPGVLYTNPECNRLLKSVLEGRGLGGLAERDDDQADERRRILEHRVHQLEQRNAALMAENEELRAKVRLLPALSARRMAMLANMTGQ